VFPAIQAAAGRHPVQGTGGGRVQVRPMRGCREPAGLGPVGSAALLADEGQRGSRAQVGHLVHHW
jgi:hypothetical protein